MGGGLIHQETLDLLQKLLDHQGEIPARVWKTVLWLQRRRQPTKWGEHYQPILGISRAGRVFWWDGTQLHDDTMRVFAKAFHGDLNEKDILVEGQEILLFIIPYQNLTARQVVWCRNAEVRSLLLQRIGNEKLLEELHGKIIHRDGDAQLISFDVTKFNVPYRLIRVKDSTTGQFYLLRVPPTMTTCHQAIAWSFGLRPEQYEPIKET